VVGRVEIPVFARSSEAFKTAEPIVITIEVSAAPIKVPVTPSLDVKNAASTEATTPATTPLPLTSPRFSSFSVMAPPIVAMCYPA
jgi:hypothetical protein